MSFRLVIGVLSLSLTLSLCGQEVVFSRRVYKKQGPSYQQIWSWNPANDVLLELTHSARDHYLPACKDAGITFVSSEKLWSFDSASGEERVIGPLPEPPKHEPKPQNGCAVFAKAGSLEACGKEEDLSVSRDNKAIVHINISTDPNEQTPIVSLEWSPDAKWLLVGGLVDLHEGDYFVVNPATKKLTKVATAFPNSVLWLPGRDELLYTTPEYLAPLPGARRERQVWLQQLIRFEPATGKSTPITSGLGNNVDAALCSK